MLANHHTPINGIIRPVWGGYLAYLLVLLACISTPCQAKLHPSDHFYEKWISSLPFQGELLESPFWEQDWKAYQAQNKVDGWSLVSGYGNKPVYSPPRNHMPKVWGLVPQDIRLRFLTETGMDHIKINLWNKGDSKLYLPRPGPKNPFSVIDQFLQDCTKENINLRKKQRKISGRLRETVWEVKLGHTLWRIQKVPGEYCMILISKRPPEIKLNPVQERLKASRPVDRSKEKELFREKLKENVQNRPNGDVVIQGIPMINQGDKGYCVPATCARIMLYYEFDTDEHEMARVMGTTAGGGTSVRSFEANLKKLASGLPIYSKGLTFSKSRVERYIKKGVPLIWLIPGHCRMIMGYNPKSGYIIYTDSWGKRGLEGTMSYKQAKAMTNRLAVLK